MSGRRNAYDNAPMESIFATLKKESTTDRIYTTHAALDDDLFDFIETFYNRKRLHSALAYRAPVDFEKPCARISIRRYLPLSSQRRAPLHPSSSRNILVVRLVRYQNFRTA